MTELNNRTKINTRYIMIFAVAVLLSWILHELAHWLMGEYLHYNMGMSLNKTFPVNQEYKNNWDDQLISAAGPVFTLLEGLFVFILMLRSRRPFLYPFLFTCFYMRFLATAISFLNANDEARISAALGLGKFTLPVIMTGILFLLVYKISKLYKFDLKFNLANTGLVMLFSSVIILADQYL